MSSFQLGKQFDNFKTQNWQNVNDIITTSITHMLFPSVTPREGIPGTNINCCSVIPQS